MRDIASVQLAHLDLKRLYGTFDRLRMAYEVYKQLQQKAGPRQIPEPRLGLTHNLGGFPAMSICSVAILGNELG